MNEKILNDCDLARWDSMATTQIPMPMKEPPERTRMKLSLNLLEMKSSFETPQSASPPFQNESYENVQQSARHPFRTCHLSSPEKARGSLKLATYLVSKENIVRELFLMCHLVLGEEMFGVLKFAMDIRLVRVRLNQLVYIV